MGKSTEKKISSPYIYFWDFSKIQPLLRFLGTNLLAEDLQKR